MGRLNFGPMADRTRPEEHPKVTPPARPAASEGLDVERLARALQVQAPMSWDAALLGAQRIAAAYDAERQGEQA